MAGRYYWLKLQKDFFKRHDIRIIESMPNGKDYILFYLKLLLESVTHDGRLRFSDKVPYNEHMLATVTDTNVDIVRCAIQVFGELDMIEVMDDGTYFMSEVQKMIGSASGSDSAARVRRYREHQKLLAAQCPDDGALQNVTHTVTKCNESKSKSKSKSKSIDTKKDVLSNDNTSKESRFAPPCVEEVAGYIREKGYHIDAETFCAFYDSNGWKVGRNPMRDWRRALVTWEKRRRTDTTHTEAPAYRRLDDDF